MVESTLWRMKTPERSVTLPLAFATGLAMEIHLMRGECSDAARDLMRDAPPDEIGLQECAVLEEALAKAQRVLQSAVASITRLRAARGLSPE